MDALCIFDAASTRLLAVDASWERLFGHSAKEARSIGVGDLVAHPEELLARVRRRTTGAARGLFRHRSGAEFLAEFAMGIHPVEGQWLGTLQIEARTTSDWASDARALAGLEDEASSDVVVPPHLKAAMRERIARCSRQQAALLQLASLDDADFESLTRRLLRTDAETLEVDRVSWWRLTQGSRSIVCEALYDRRRGVFESGLELTAATYPRYFKALVTGALIPAHDAITDPRTDEFAEGYLRPLGIGALLDVPVFMRGDLIGIVCHEHVGGVRGWTMDEQQFALSVGQLLSLTLAGRHGEDAARSIRQKDALLAEVNAGLDRALRPGDGPCTGKTLGRYRMDQLIGRGGMGDVYRAVRGDDGVVVAVKVLRSSLAADPDNVQRLFREARLTAAVPSDHVARVHEVGTFEDGSAFIAMELLEGHDLAWHLRRVTQLPIAQVVELVDHASRALAAVRRAGVVHRDLKPQNLFLVDAIPRAWKVLDFGLSRSEEDPFVTRAGAVAGTLQYMSPEQLVGDPTDHRSDLYALGAIAYRALAGRPPFVGEMQSIISSILTETPPAITSLVDGLPADLDLVFTLALARVPDDRFADVEAFAAALQGAAQGTLDPGVRAAAAKVARS